MANLDELKSQIAAGLGASVLTAHIAHGELTLDIDRDKIVEVLREIATISVEEFTRRTGQPFLWVDEPELPVDDTPMMSFSLDEKGNVTW